MVPAGGWRYNGEMQMAQKSSLMQGTSPMARTTRPGAMKSGRSFEMHGTTILCVRRDSRVVMVGDGQVTLGDNVVKHTARKTRRLFSDKVLAGFAGATADAISLFERFESKVQGHHGNLQKASVELAKEGRRDRALRPPAAMLIVADAKATVVLSRNRDGIGP